jgi:3-dehydroquinate synthase
MSETAASTAEGEPTTVTVDLGPRSYDILIGRGVLERAGSEIAKRLPNAAVAIVTDRNVADHYLRPLTDNLALAGIRSAAVVIEPGEGSKCFSTLESTVDKILAAGIERRDAIVALGGGVVGDLAGFAPGVTLRGIPTVRAPVRTG